MRYQSTLNAPDYFPPILGNGEISFSVDCEGATDFDAAYNGIRAFSGVIFRAGRRLPIFPNRTPARILSFGRLTFDAGSPLDAWEQELSETEGVVRSSCSYENGMQVDSECFIHPQANLYALEKCFSNTGASQTVTITYTLCGYDRDTENAVTVQAAKITPNSAYLPFRVYGQDVYTGAVVLCAQAERPVEIWAEGNTVSLRYNVSEGERIRFYLMLEDDLYTRMPESILADWQERVESDGYGKLLAETVQSWTDFFAEGFVQTPDEQLNRIYRVALYHLRCYTTRWSIPVGLNDGSWDGKYFAFDEYYCMLGLLGANQIDLARRVPEFRLRVCLDKAIERATRLVDEEARFAWETSEYGEEVARPGYWYEHIFHTALVAQGAFEYYEHTGDLEFLRECYRMIRACAKYYTQHMIYRDGDRMYIGKCTDLERLGSSVENPFMTSCGVISTLEVLAKAAVILGTDGEYREECLKTAQKLRESLPVEDGRYVPVMGNPQKSIAVFAGKFPFDVLSDTDEKMLKAWDDFVMNESDYGNMYKMGKRVSPWYACWKAEGYARTKRAREAYESLRQAYESTGVFGEMFEINEQGHRLRPWFATASGIFLSSVNEMLVHSDGETVNILPAFPEMSGTICFRLSVKGGAVLQAEIRDGEIVRAAFTPKEGAQLKRFRVLLRGQPVSEQVVEGV